MKNLLSHLLPTAIVLLIVAVSPLKTNFPPLDLLFIGGIILYAYGFASVTKLNKQERTFKIIKKLALYVYWSGLAFLIAIQFLEALYLNVFSWGTQIALTSIVLLIAPFFLFTHQQAIFDGIRRESTKGNLLHTGTLIVLMICMAVLTLYKLGDQDFYSDEFLQSDAAYNFTQEGDFYQWDWIANDSGKNTKCIEEEKYCNYTRAWPHTLLVAASYKVFGISEWSARFVSAILGIALIPLMYWIATFFSQSRTIAILVAATVVTHAQFIEFARYTRMYILFICIFLPLTVLIYLLITRGDTSRLTSNFGKLRPYLSYDYRLLLITLPILYVAYLTHINSLIIVPAVLAFSFVMLGLEQMECRKKYLLITLAGSVGIVGMLFVYSAGYLGIISEYSFLTPFQIRNYEYLAILLNYPLHVFLTLPLVFVPVLVTLLDRNFFELRRKMIFLACLVSVTLLFFIFVANRYVGFTYVSHISSVVLILAVTGFYWSTFIFSRIIRHFLLTLFVVAIMSNLLLHAYEIVGFNPNDNFAKFSIAYQTVQEEIDIEHEVIFGQYLHSYYLKKLYGSNVAVVNMFNEKQYEYQQFLEDLQKYDSGWVIWQTTKRYHIQDAILAYAEQNFTKYHGEGVDDTGVEVYYYNKSMLSPEMSTQDGGPF